MVVCPTPAPSATHRPSTFPRFRSNQVAMTLAYATEQWVEAASASGTCSAKNIQ